MRFSKQRSDHSIHSNTTLGRRFPERCWCCLFRPPPPPPHSFPVVLALIYSSPCLFPGSIPQRQAAVRICLYHAAQKRQCGAGGSPGQIQEEHGERAFSIWRSNEAPKKEAVTFLESAPGSLTSGPHSRKRGHILTWRSIFASELLMFHLYNLPHTQEEEGN